ncbi:uncharacterized protein BROUX77_006471 [Berkeleyomyces rouxiae]|uniref:uncharacterized protein n=1 Tax=Berkeleyomyces rouxiae TaxID=2035830 RepID=UPI003B808A9C
MAGRKLVTINLEAEHRSVKCWGPDSMCLPNDIREPMRPVLHDLRELRLSLRDIRDISAHKPSPVNYLLSETPSLEKLSLELRHSMLFKESNSIIASMASDVRYGREMRARNQVLPAMPDVWTDEGAWHIENHLELLPFPIDLACLRELKLTGMSLCTSVLQSVLETFLPQLTKLSLQDIRIVDGPILKIQAAAHPYYVHSDESPEWHGIFVRLAEISKDTAHKKLWFSLRQLTRVRQNVPQVIIYLLPAPPTRQANHQTTPKRLTHQYMEYETTMLDRVYGFESLAKSMATTEFGLYSRLREEEPVEYHELSGDT